MKPIIRNRRKYLCIYFFFFENVLKTSRICLQTFLHLFIGHRSLNPQQFFAHSSLFRIITDYLKRNIFDRFSVNVYCKTNFGSYNVSGSLPPSARAVRLSNVHFTDDDTVKSSSTITFQFQVRFIKSLNNIYNTIGVIKSSYNVATFIAVRYDTISFDTCISSTSVFSIFE